MDNLELKKEDRVTVPAATETMKDASTREKGKDGIVCGAAQKAIDCLIDLRGCEVHLIHLTSAPLFASKSILED